MHQDGPAFADKLHVGRPNIGSSTRFLELASSALDSRWLSNDGPLVRELEGRIADRIGVRHCIAVNNGTIGLEILVRALGLTGEVIVPSWTFIATAHALRWLGLTPVFADIDPRTHCLDPDSVRSALSERTSAILAVHLWGRAAPVDELHRIADDAGVALIFDAAHAFGVSARGRSVGTFGRAEVFSFHATKFFNTLEGGAITTDDDDLADRLRRMRNFGFVGEDQVVDDGTNGKMNEICAAMGLVNLDHVDDFIAVNRRNFERYRAGVEGLPGLSLISIDPTEQSNYQYVVVIVEDACTRSRDELLAELRANNVLARRYFWPGCHQMEPYRSLQPHLSSQLPNTERIAEQVMVLPTGTSVDEDQIDAVIGVLRRTLQPHLVATRGE